MDRRNFIKKTSAATAGLYLGKGINGLASSNSTYHIVSEGETLTGISSAYGVKLQDVQKTNRMVSTQLKTGERLFIPHYSNGYKPPAPTNPLVSAMNKPMREWKYLVIHHSGTLQGSAASFDDYHRRKRRMENGLAYHFVIGNGTGSKDGLIEIGDRWKKQIHGGHVRSDWYNNTGIGICLVGNFEKNRPTSKQMESANKLVEYLHNHLLKGKVQLAGHRELSTEQTLCPGKFFPLSTMHQRYS